MVGLQATAIKMQLGPLLNGVVNYDFWLPVQTMIFPGVEDLLKKYQAQAPRPKASIRSATTWRRGLCHLQMLGRRSRRPRASTTKSSPTTCARAPSRPCSATSRFGKDGEWAQSRVLQVQFQGIKGNGIDQFKDVKTQIVLTPNEYTSGSVVYPYEKAK